MWLGSYYSTFKFLVAPGSEELVIEKGEFHTEGGNQILEENVAFKIMKLKSIKQ